MTKYEVYEDTTLDKFLRSFYLSKSNIYKIINSNYYINGKLTNSLDLKKGDYIEFDLSGFDKSYIVPFKYKLDIRYEDDYVLVVNKPIKMLIHPDGNNYNTLLNAVSFYFEINNINATPIALHRLDYDTSGLVMFSKDPLSHSFINNQIENRLIKKEYIAILEGSLEKNFGIIDLPIGRNRHDSKKYIVSIGGKNAITKYEVIERFNNKTKVRVNIETGRTHQIRVHFCHLKHPIVGDEIYGKSANRLYLHSSKIRFIHPNTRKQLTVELMPKRGVNNWIL